MSDIENIIIEYANSIDNISIDYTNTISTIELTLGQYVQNVTSVNGLLGVVNLTASTTLSSPTSSGGFYSFNFNHGLSYQHPIVFVYDLNDSMVFADVIAADDNNVTINAMIDISGYKAVAQR